MEIEVRRRWFTEKSVCGELFVDGQRECYTLEPSKTTPVFPSHPAIPTGRYRVILTPSPELGYVTPELLDVPGRTAIRIHIGNFPKDVKGCTVVGQAHTLDFVGSSKQAFDSLMTLLRTATDEIWAEYSEPTPNT